MRLVTYAMLVVLCVAFTGCATLGIGDPPSEQAALEGASAAMVVHYLKIKDDDITDAQLAIALVTQGDNYISTLYPDSGWTYVGLVQDYIKKISNGKLNPNVGLIYFFVIGALEELQTSQLDGTELFVVISDKVHERLM